MGGGQVLIPAKRIGDFHHDGRSDILVSIISGPHQRTDRPFFECLLHVGMPIESFPAQGHEQVAPADGP